MSPTSGRPLHHHRSRIAGWGDVAGAISPGHRGISHVPERHLDNPEFRRHVAIIVTGLAGGACSLSLLAAVLRWVATGSMLP